MRKTNSLSPLLKGLPWRFFRKLALMQIIITTVTIICTAYLGRYYLKTYVTNQTKEQLSESLQFIKQFIVTQKLPPQSWCGALQSNWKTRHTVINKEGRVLCDNFVTLNTMDNHADRPEVIEAFNSGSGYSKRHSDSYNTEMLYAAIAIKNPSNPKEEFIIRHSTTLKEIDNAMRSLESTIIMYAFPVLVIISLLFLWGSLQVAFPLRSILSKIDRLRSFTGDNPPQYLIGPSDEWDLVEKALDRAKVDLEKHLDDIAKENEKMSKVMESISDSILAVNQSYHILFANNQFKKNFLTRQISNEELPNLKIWEVTRNLDIQNLIETVFKNHTIVKRRSTALSLNSGQKYYFDITVSPLADVKGIPFGAVCVFHDVTQRRSAEQMREDFVSNVSHELRTPLTALKGYAQVLKSALEKENDNKYKEYLDKIESSSNRLIHLFEDILNLSRIESRNDIKKSMVDINELTKRVLTNVKQAYNAKNISCKSSIEVEQVWANPGFLEQVVTNLVDNAFKYTPSGGSISISWKGDKDFDILQVQDSGIGIPKEHQARLFERFYRVDPSRSRELGGTGLGLAIVKHIVQKHLGEINVESNPNEGSTFTVKFPHSTLKA